MRLHVAEREFYKPVILPPGLTYELSVDGGTTWHASDLDQDGQPAFLLHGPEYVPTDGAGLLVTRTVRPLIRVKDQPEALIASGPWINLWK